MKSTTRTVSIPFLSGQLFERQQERRDECGYGGVGYVVGYHRLCLNRFLISANLPT